GVSARRGASADDPWGLGVPDGGVAGGLGAGAGGGGVTVVVGAVVVGAGVAGFRMAVSLAQPDRSSTVDADIRTRRVTWARCPALPEASGPSPYRAPPRTPRRSGRRASAPYDKPSRARSPNPAISSCSTAERSSRGPAPGCRRPRPRRGSRRSRPARFEHRG